MHLEKTGNTMGIYFLQFEQKGDNFRDFLMAFLYTLVIGSIQRGKN